MLRYTSTRLLSTIPVILLVSIVTFVSIRILPGDLAVVKLGQNASPEDVKRLREILGLDVSLHLQYFDWIRGMLRGDPGQSLTTNLPVGDQLWRRLPVTLELAVLSMTFAGLLGIPLGIVSAVRQGRAIDHVVRVFAVLGQAVPNFWTAMVALTFLSLYAGWVPPFVYRSFWTEPWHNTQQFLLPMMILGYGLAAIIMRLTRSAMLEVLRQDYMRTARAKGLGERTLIYRHALRNALIPIVTVVGTQLGALIGGTVIIEQIFSLPGIGRLTLRAIIDRDYTQLQFNVLFIASAVVLANLLVDLSYAFLDPRIRIGQGIDA